MIERIFDLYVKGTGTGFIANTINAEGWHTPSGNRYSASVILGILRNEKYIGNIVHKGIKSEGTHEGIIERKIFKKVQEILNRRGTGARKHKKINPKRTKFLLGSTFCGLCGRRLYASTAGNGRKTIFLQKIGVRIVITPTE